MSLVDKAKLLLESYKTGMRESRVLQYYHRSRIGLFHEFVERLESLDHRDAEIISLKRFPFDRRQFAHCARIKGGFKVITDDGQISTYDRAEDVLMDWILD